MARLVLQTAEGEKVVELRAHNSLGRHPSNSIQLLDKIVSKEHCVIEQRGTQFILRDLGSLNGTFINRDRVHGEAPLMHNDEIALGSTRARFEEAAAPAAFPPAGAGAGYPAPQPVQAQPPPVQPAWPPQPGQAPAGTPQQVGYARQQLAPASQGQVRPKPVYPPQPPRPAPLSGRQPEGPGSRQPPRRPPPPARTAARGFSTAYLPQVTTGTRVDHDDEARQIGAEIAAVEHEFQAFDDIAGNASQLRADYERLRFSYELTKDIAKEKDTGKLLEKILKSMFRFIPAQRGVIFLQDESGELTARASHRNDGSSAPISVSTTILRQVVDEKKAVLTHDAAMDFAASKGKSMILNQIQSAIVAPMLHKDEILGVLWLDSKSLAQFQPKDLQLISAVANQAAMFIEINILGKQIEEELVNRERLSRLLSPNVAERVISGQVEVKPGGARCQCTVFNSDIRGFTRMSENTSPEEIVEMLNEYFEDMVDIIFKYEGTLDKFMGDGIMALFGAPVSHPDDAERAVECALEQLEVLEEYNAKRRAQNRPGIGVGLGIHTGPVVAGYIGSSKALSYTVIGDVANTSARLCAKAGPGQILVSEDTYAALGARFKCDEMPPTKIKGKEQPMNLYNVVGRAPTEQVPATAPVGGTPRNEDAPPQHSAVRPDSGRETA